MSMRRWAIVSALVAASASANAAVTSFNDLASFSAATGSLNLETFNDFQAETSFHTTALSLGGGAFQVHGFGANLSSRNFIDLPPAQFIDFDVDGTTIMNSFVAPDTPVFPGPTIAPATGFEFTFGAPINAFGFDFAAMQNSPAQQTQIVTAGTTLTPPVQNGNRIGFYGFVSNTPFTTIRFIGLANDGFGIDNVRWSNAVTPAVPEPETWLMLIGGFGMAGTAIRRQRAIAAR
jgi:hypothetical protein